MLDFETFLTTLYVKVDDFCKSFLPPEKQSGRKPSLSASEVVTIALIGQWQRFASERDYYRFAKRHLTKAFPNLPDRSQFNRLERANYELIIYFSLSLVDLIEPNPVSYEALDATAIVTRHAKRRGRGHLAGLSNLGYSNRLGWFHGMHLLVSSTPRGTITGYGFGAGSTKDQKLAETFFGLRHGGEAWRLPSVGNPKSDYYAVDKGFEGFKWRRHWRADYGITVVGAPQRSGKAKKTWPKPLRRWIASIRQIIETVNDKLIHTFRLGRERPHDLSGLQARLAAKVALHNFCIWLNLSLGRPLLAFAELLVW